MRTGYSEVMSKPREIDRTFFCIAPLPQSRKTSRECPLSQGGNRCLDALFTSAVIGSHIFIFIEGIVAWCVCSVENNFEYYWRVYTLCFQLGLKQAMKCEGLRHVVGISAPGCNLSQSPRLWFDDRGQVCFCPISDLLLHLSTCPESCTVKQMV